MTDEANHLAAILARPGDDLMRTAYADWLEGTDGMAPCVCNDGIVSEQWKTTEWGGQAGFTVQVPRQKARKRTCSVCNGTGEVSNGHAERAEFIRVQCEIAIVDEAVWEWGESDRDKTGLAALSNHLGALRRRERELLDKFAAVWLEATWQCDMGAVGQVYDYRNDVRYHGGWCAGDESTPTIDANFHRGFVEEIASSWSDWKRHADAIRKAMPLRKARLTDWPDVRWHHDAVADRLEELARLYPGIEFELPQRTELDDDFADWPSQFTELPI